MVEVDVHNFVRQPLRAIASGAEPGDLQPKWPLCGFQVPIYTDKAELPFFRLFVEINIAPRTLTNGASLGHRYRRRICNQFDQRRRRISELSGEDSLTTPIIRVFVVEDFEPFRKFLSSTLQKQPQFQIILEVEDGLRAVQKAEELQPDLILLDIGLPALNGIEAARRIRMASAKSKIVFVSQESSTDMVQEAFDVGARGYVVKTDAGSELLTAVNAVLRGERSVSSSLAGIDLSNGKDGNGKDAQASAHPDRKDVVAPLPPRNVTIRHEVAFYPDDAALVEAFAGLCQAALGVENAVVLIATVEHRSDILKRLRSNAVDVDGAIKNGSLVQLDAIDTVSTLMVDDFPDVVRCEKLVGDVVRGAFKTAKGAYPRVAICGECAPALLREGNAEAAVRLEHLWDEITRRYNADTLCGYLWSVFPEKDSSPIFARICAEHSAVVGRELGYWARPNLSRGITCKLAQLSFWNRELCTNAVQANHHLQK